MDSTLFVEQQLSSVTQLPEDPVDNGVDFGTYSPSAEDQPSMAFMDYSQVQPSPPAHGELLPLYSIVCDGCPTIDVYDNCLKGICTCRHTIGGCPADLKPCRLGDYLYGYSAVGAFSDAECDFLWSGFSNGFKIVDDECRTTYRCKNYDSILTGDFKVQMDSTIVRELSEHKVTPVDHRPKCIHALGAVEKADGSLRPITDCSKPDKISINNFMTSTYRYFTYNSV